ncbi:hypothetical protein [Nonomuraea longicatena]|uniref:Glycosyltransferase RgtA/B/C/D-like domain-containing protein n=1 Tax=Nonomuraea longicatena TaxID=83682 RepID=A0ABP3ZXL0_9ACTN
MAPFWLDETRRPSAGRVLAVASLLPALLVAGWLLAGLPLLMLGLFRPLPVTLLAAAFTAVLAWMVVRDGSGRGSSRDAARPLSWSVALRWPLCDATPWQTVGVLAAALASGVFNALLHSEQLIVRRDPATYAQYTTWIAEHGSLPIPRQEWAFGGPDPGLEFLSVGFYDHGGAVVPQFMPGAPMLHSAAAWLGGLMIGPAVLGALAVLTVGGLAARLAGGRWAPLAALTFAVSLPILYTSRTTFSEIPSLILLFGGLILLHDARAALRGAGAAPNDAGAVRGAGSSSGEAYPAGTSPGEAHPGAGLLGGRRGAWCAGLAGLLFGLATLVRIDGLRDVLPVLVFAGLLIALRRLGRPGGQAVGRPAVQAVGQAVGRTAGHTVGHAVGVLGGPLLAGLVAGVALGFAAALVFARPYLSYLSRSVVPLLVICGAVLVLTLAGTALAPRVARSLARLRRPRLLPEAGAALVVLVMAGFAVRPWLQTVRREPVSQADVLTARFIADTQKANGLPVDGTRLYFEDSLLWVVWYVGLPVVVLATLAAAVLVRRMLRDGSSPEWLLPLAVIGFTTVTTLLRPEITPDQPWASRRLVPVVIPGLVLLGVWGLGWLRDKTGRLGYGPRTRSWVAGVGAVLVLVPPAVTSIGTAFTPIERGERAAVEAMCARIPADASVLFAERVTADRFTQLVRGMCGRPAASVRREEGDLPAPDEVRRLAARVAQTGRTPVLLAAAPEQLAEYGRPVEILSLSTRQDERSLVKPPDGTWRLQVRVWMAVL